MQRIVEAMNRNPAIPAGMAVVFFLLFVLTRTGQHKDIRRERTQPGGILDRVILWWSQSDPLRIRDLLNGGVLILGRAGSGKTSSSGRTLLQKIVNLGILCGGLILAAKPEDAEDIQAIFRKAGRLGDLIVFDAEGGRRCNFLNCLKRPRDVVHFLTTLSEALKRGDSKGGDNSRFYDAQEQRCLASAVTPLQLAGEPLAAPNLHAFIMTAAASPAELTTPQWQARYHAQVMDRAFNAPKTPLERQDFQLCLDFWTVEWPGLMDTKTRGNILAGVQGTLHAMNTGLAREMVSGATNCSPEDVLAGKWILVNFPPSSWGATGQLISVGWKHLVELALLERKAETNSPVCVLWCDEAHQFITEFDGSFIAQCRSHLGCLCYLSQSVSSFYSALKGDAGRHQADALLANFSHVIVHACDPVTAQWAAAKLGRQREILYGGGVSPQPDRTVWEDIFGQPHVNGSFSEHYEPLLQDQAFMVGRTGGPANGFIADAILLRSGEPFSDGLNFKRAVFSQR